MIVSRQHFDLGNRCVIEKLIIKTPYRFDAIFQNGACFLHFKNEHSILSLPTQILDIGSSEGVLVNCGHYFIDFLKKAAAPTIEVYAVHLYADLLKDIYKDSIPQIVTHKAADQYAKKITSQIIIDHFISSLIFYFEYPDLVNQELLILKIKELILLLLQADNSVTITELLTDLFSPRQANLKDVVQQHLFSNLSVNELAKLAGLSLSSFKRDFQNIYNDTPANYLRAKKLKKLFTCLKNLIIQLVKSVFKLASMILPILQKRSKSKQVYLL